MEGRSSLTANTQPAAGKADPLSNRSLLCGETERQRYVKVKVREVKIALEEAMKFKKASRNIVLLFLYLRR